MSSPRDSAETDVVVIGSGFGGSAAAHCVASVGQRVLLLERGPWRDSLPVRSMGVKRRAPYPYERKAVTHLLHSLHRGRFDLRLNRAGMYEAFFFPNLSVVVASGVGGGSTAYGGLLEAPRNPSLWRGRHPELDPDSIERYYDKVIADMGGVPISREQPLPQSVWTHFPSSNERRCRPAEQQPHAALLIPSSAAEAGKSITSTSGLQRQYCAFDGDSFLGSRGGAKASVEFIYIAPVLNNGVTVRDLCEVTRIERARPVDGSGYVVHFTDLTTKAAGWVRAKRVVLAAGAMNTVRLLFASAAMPDGLVAMPALGRGFSANGDLLGTWERKSARVSSFFSTPSHGAFTVEGHDNATYGVGGFPGLETLPLPSVLKRRIAKTFFLYGMGRDSGTGSVSCEDGHLCVSYDPRKEPIYDEVRAAFRVLSNESGDKLWAIGKPLTVHAGGGACVGPDAEHGVVDHRGQVYGNPGLFVADGAALPTAVGGPP